jgi:hypothetical protein
MGVQRIIHQSLRINLDSVLDQGIDYEYKILENIRRCRKLLGTTFRFILWHNNLEESVIKNFVRRNEKILFEVDTKITHTIGTCWFLIDPTEKDKSNSRYRWHGETGLGIVKFMEMVNFLKSKE